MSRFGHHPDRGESSTSREFLNKLLLDCQSVPVAGNGQLIVMIKRQLALLPTLDEITPSPSRLAPPSSASLPDPLNPIIAADQLPPPV